MTSLLRAYRECSAQAATSSFDEVTATLNNTAKQELLGWITTATANEPVPMVAASGEPDLCIVFDASAKGFGAFSMSRGANEWKVVSGAWPSHLRDKATSSVFAEPEAGFAACARFVRSTDRFVRLFTDHSPIVYADKAGYAKGFYPNQLLKRLREAFPWCVFEIVHLKGVHNPADTTSRFGRSVGEDYIPSLEEVEKLAKLEAVMWEGLVKNNVPVSAYNEETSFMV